LWDFSKIPAVSPLTAAGALIADPQPQLGVRYALHKWVLFKLVNCIVKDGFTYYMSHVPLYPYPDKKVKKM
jgi:hypothetical protein